MRTIEIYDTTLRDGSQGEGVHFSLADKLAIARRLDEIGVDFIEGGYPLSNPKDAQFFEQVRDLGLRHAKVFAFGMTRRRGMEASADPGMKALLDAGTVGVTIVGKTSAFHVSEVLGVSREENLAMITDTVAFLTGAGREVFTTPSISSTVGSLTPRTQPRRSSRQLVPEPRGSCCATPMGAPSPRRSPR